MMKAAYVFAGIVRIGLGIALSLSACRLGSVCTEHSGGTVLATSTGGTGGTGGAMAGGGGNLFNFPEAGILDGPDPNTPTEKANCGLIPFDVTRKPADVLLVLDRSASMIEHEVTGLNGQQVTRAQAAKDAVNAIIQQTETTLEWGLKMFPQGYPDYCLVTPDTVDVPPALNNYTAISSVINADAFNGNGTPTAAAVFAGHNYLRNIVTDSNSKYLILATDGEPSTDSQNQCTGTWAIPDVKTAAVDQVTAAWADGIKTFVIGVNTTTGSNVTLNRLVQAGQTAAPPIATGEDVTSSKDTQQHYYAANDYQGLLDDLSTITGQISDCRFSLGTLPPPVPDNVVVKVTDTSGSLVRVPRDANQANGWDYTGSDQLTIEVYGYWCDQVKAPTANNKVSIIFGCKDQVIE